MTADDDANVHDDTDDNTDDTDPDDDRHHCHNACHITGVFPDGVDSELLYEYGYCSTPLVDPSLYAACVSQQLSFQDIMLNSFPKHLEVPFGYIQVRVLGESEVFVMLIL